MFERRLYYHIDWALLVAILALCAIGVAMIYSTTVDPTAARRSCTSPSSTRIALGLVAMVVSLTHRLPHAHRQVALDLPRDLLALLLYVLFFGAVQMGARRWIPLGRLQPAAVGVRQGRRRARARQVLRREPRRADAGPIWPSAARSPWCRSLLIARQPDLGTAVTLMPVFLAIAYLAGHADAHPRHPRARRRARGAGRLEVRAEGLSEVAHLDVSRSVAGCEGRRVPADPGAHHRRVRRAWGKGFKKGTQGQLRFLPVAHNDFIFSVLAEEQGFAGVLVALGLYLFVILRALEAARLAKDRLGSYLVLGVLASFTFQVIYNITMSAGLAPVKGLTLPLMSYGGSSMIATLAGFGLILNVRMRRFTN